MEQRNNEDEESGAIKKEGEPSEEIELGRQSEYKRTCVRWSRKRPLCWSWVSS